MLHTQKQSNIQTNAITLQSRSEHALSISFSTISAAFPVRFVNGATSQIPGKMSKLAVCHEGFFTLFCTALHTFCWAAASSSNVHKQLLSPFGQQC